MSRSSAPFVHKTVMLNEAVAYLDVKPGKVYVDATFGGGGHTRAILEADPGCHVIAFDWHRHALDSNGPALEEEFPDRLTLIFANFTQMPQMLKRQGIEKVDGILADFGTSQYQIFECPGFSFAYDSPLDMRMSNSHFRVTAADILAQASADELAHIFYLYGEESHGRKIARAIVEERGRRPFKTTMQLADFIETLVPRRGRGIHPATKVFQALRIAVNHELDNIKTFLQHAPSLLNPGGRLVCISFHSLEDRLVKIFFKEQKEALCNLTPKVVVATPEECKANPSSRSAKLRAAEYCKPL
jgi:16S rRNA (cytosine1402-N4)-methyltransferase